MQRLCVEESSKKFLPIVPMVLVASVLMAPAHAGTLARDAFKASSPTFLVLAPSKTPALPVVTPKETATVLTPETTVSNLATADYILGDASARIQTVDWWIGGLNWSRWWEFWGHWKEIASNKIDAVRIGWKREVLKAGLRSAIGGVAGYKIRQYYRSQGLYCPDKPWWIPSSIDHGYAILTCAEYAR